MTRFSFLFLYLFASAASALGEIVVIPAKFTLSGPMAHQELIVEELRSGKLVGQLTNDLALNSTDPAVVRLGNGVALPLTNGTATVTVKVGTQSAKAEVTVEGMDKPFEWSFRNH